MRPENLPCPVAGPESPELAQSWFWHPRRLRRLAQTEADTLALAWAVPTEGLAWATRELGQSRFGHQRALPKAVFLVRGPLQPLEAFRWQFGFFDPIQTCCSGAQVLLCLAQKGVVKRAGPQVAGTRFFGARQFVVAARPTAQDEAARFRSIERRVAAARALAHSLLF